MLVPAYACVALPNAVAALGAEPVAVDVEPDTWTIDPAAAAAAGPAAAVLAVHTFGAPAAVAALQVAGARVVDDAAHGLPPGVAHAGATVTSFYATKLVGGAEGGAVLSDDPAIAAFARSERDYTDRPVCGERLNDKMNDLEAALTLAQLRRLPALVDARAAARGPLRAAARGPTPGSSSRPRAPGRSGTATRSRRPPCPAAELVARLREHGVAAERPVTDWRDAAEREAAPVAARAYDAGRLPPALPHADATTSRTR